jgi:hypothetical protein
MKSKYGQAAAKTCFLYLEDDGKSREQAKNPAPLTADNWRIAVRFEFKKLAKMVSRFKNGNASISKQWVQH